jgi:hypothetical protein
MERISCPCTGDDAEPVVLVTARVPPQFTWRKLSRRFCLGHNVVPPIYNGDRGRRSVGQGDARGGRSVGGRLTF